jgi:LmbE family N-acetylglucosaminyl deacetylase
MSAPLRLLCVLAHPDDEALGLGGLLARCASEGVETYLLTATRGERGWQGPPAEDPGPAALGALREAELRCAAEALQLKDVTLLGYMDGELDQQDPAEATARIAAHIRRVRPQVLVTFGPDGAYGHPDHVAVSQFTTAAVVQAAAEGEAGAPPHRVLKLYYRTWTLGEQQAYQNVFPELVMLVDGDERRAVGWDEWMISARIDTEEYWPTVWRAIQCHVSQLPGYHRLAQLTPELHRELWGCQGYYRAFSLVNGGRERESDLFAGLR